MEGINVIWLANCIILGAFWRFEKIIGLELWECMEGINVIWLANCITFGAFWPFEKIIGLNYENVFLI